MDTNSPQPVKRPTAQHALWMSEQRNAFLLKLSDSLRPLTDPEQIQLTAARLLGQQIGADNTYFGYIDPETTAFNSAEFIQAEAVHLAGESGYFPFTDALTILRQEQVLIVENVQSEVRFSQRTKDAYLALKVGAFASVPLTRGGRIWALSAASTQPRTWAPEQIELMRDVAQRTLLSVQIAVAEQALCKSEEALRLEDQRKNEFLAMLSHELRNPLATLYNTLLLLTLTKGQEQSLPLEKAVDIMSREVNHLTQMVDGFLDVSRIRQGKIQLSRKRVNLSQLIQEAIEANRSEFASRQQQVTLFQPSSSVWMMGDATRLTQVVQNLLVNAAKYTPSGGQIRVTLEETGGQAQLQVMDTGIGLAPDQLERIFEVFEQVSTSLARPQGGLGLGLAVVKRLVEQHGGNVKASSQGLGRGSQFTVVLPTQLVSNMAVKQASEDGDESTVSRRILVVDDNADLALTTAMLLKMKHYEAHTRLSGTEALEAVVELNPKAVLLDLGMPGMDGYETARRLRALPWGQSGKIIALSGYGQEADRTRTREAGFDEHLVKPMNLNELTTLLTTILG